jgi:hypothetical protein
MKTSKSRGRSLIFYRNRVEDREGEKKPTNALQLAKQTAKMTMF